MLTTRTYLDLTELIVVRHKSDVQLTAPATGRYFLRAVTHTGYDHRAVASQQQRIRAVGIGDGAIGRAFLLKGNEFEPLACNTVRNIAA